MNTGDDERDLFQPLRPAHGTKLVLAAGIGPIAWVILWLLAIWLFSKSKAIEFGRRSGSTWASGARVTTASS